MRATLIPAPRTRSDHREVSADIRFGPVDPRSAALRNLFEQSDALMAALYPAQSNHLAPADELSAPGALLIGGYVAAELVACGAVRVMADDGVYGELKRVFISPAYRGKGLSRELVSRLEQDTLAHGVLLMRLETGVRQPEAIGLYQSMGYREREPFGRYQPDPLSLFMEKSLTGSPSE